MSKKYTLSLVIPAYNESAGIQLFHDNILKKYIDSSDYSFSIYYVNDGSSDDTLAKLNKIADRDDSVHIVNLSRNFGKEIAVSAGLRYADGDATIIIDADGQHPPATIDSFIKKWRNGAQVVIGVRDSNEKEGLIKKYGSKLFYRLMNSAIDADIIPKSTDFRLIDKEVRESINTLDEKNRITRGLIDWLGYQREVVHFRADARMAGEASYKISSLFKLAIDSFISLSIRPLIALAVLGGTIAVAALLLGVFVLIEYYIIGDPLHLNPSGTAQLAILIVFLVGLILTAQGITAMYIAHIHEQSQNRPLFVVNTHGSRRIS